MWSFGLGRGYRLFFQTVILFNTILNSIKIIWMSFVCTMTATTQSFASNRQLSHLKERQWVRGWLAAGWRSPLKTLEFSLTLNVHFDLHISVSYPKLFKVAFWFLLTRDPTIFSLQILEKMPIDVIDSASTQ